MLLGFMNDLLATNEFNIFIRIVIAIVLGIVVGIGKELFVRPAGFRMSTIVTIASCLVTLVGVYAFKEALSSIIGGILVCSGLITLGIINNNRGEYQGMVSAIMVVLCSVIGITSASGLYFAAIVATLLTVGVMIVLRTVEKNMLTRGHVLNIIVDSNKPVLKNLLDILSNNHLSTTSIESKVVLFERKECVKIRVEFIRATSRIDIERLLPVIKEHINPLSISVRNDTHGVVK